MALESSDLNDGHILQQTRQITDQRGNIQFNITLPSGRVLKSEFINKDDVRAGMRKWLDVVKEQAVADSNVERLERAAKAKRGKMDIERKPGDDQPLFRAGGARVDDPVEQRSHDAVDRAEMKAVPDVLADQSLKTIERLLDQAKKLDQPAEVDPLEFAKQQRDIYEKRYQDLLAVQQKLRQWTIIVEQLEELE